MIEWQTLHKEMLADIEKCWQMLVPEAEQIEYAFKIAGNYWQKLKSHLKNYQFENENEEIDFYKNIKPAFTSYLEYFPLIYSTYVLKPAEDVDAIQRFWEKEEKRLSRFMEKNAAFVEYYKSGSAEQDLHYFVRANHDRGNYIGSKAYDMDGDYMTSHDYLVAAILAQEMYHEYVKKKLVQSG